MTGDGRPEYQSHYVAESTKAGMVAPAKRFKRQANLHEFKASLVYTMSSRSARTT